VQRLEASETPLGAASDSPPLQSAQSRFVIEVYKKRVSGTPKRRAPTGGDVSACRRIGVSFMQNADSERRFHSMFVARGESTCGVQADTPLPSSPRAGTPIRRYVPFWSADTRVNS
jgi:hypothetical protein